MQLRYAFYATACLRALGTSALGVFLGVALAQRGYSAQTIGFIVTAGLAGTAVAAALVTFWGSGARARPILMTLAGLNAGGLAALWFFRSPMVVALAAFVGMANGMGRDRGAALAIEQALLPSTGASNQRTRTIAWYTLLQDVGHAIGALLPAAVGVLAANRLNAAANDLTLAALVCVSLVTLGVYARWAPAAGASPPRQQISAQSRGMLAKICALFAIDALGGGFLTTALVSYFFFERFGVGTEVIGPLFFAARLMNAVSHLGAAKLAERIGLVRTMVFTHIPSSLLLVTVAFAPTLPIAIVLFLLREGLVEMDVPTRQSYVLAVVEPHERTFASGVTNLVRLAAWAIAPWFAGTLMRDDQLYLPLVIGAAMKIAYDLALWRAFISVVPPEERAAGKT